MKVYKIIAIYKNKHLESSYDSYSDANSVYEELATYPFDNLMMLFNDSRYYPVCRLVKKRFRKIKSEK